MVYGGWPTVSETGGLWFYPFGKVIPALNLFLGKGFLPSWQEGFMGVQDNTGGGKKGQGLYVSMTRWITVTLFGCDFTCQLLIVGHGENNWHWNLFSMIIYIFSMIICTFPCQNNLIFIYLIIFTNIFDGIPFPNVYESWVVNWGVDP